MSTQYNIYNYIKGINGFGLALSDTIFTATLTANTDTTVTVPGLAAAGAATAYQYNKLIAIIDTISGPLWVAVNAVAAVPAGATLAASTSRLVNPYLPMGLYVKGGDVLHFLTPSTGVEMSVAFYTIQEG